jgi:phosphate starvation-inducible PhoH-like protein
MKHKKNLVDNNINTNATYSKDTSPIIHQRSKLKSNLNLSSRPLTDKQKEFLDLVLNKQSKLVFVSGPAGSSKSFMAVYAALMLIGQKKVSDLVYIRSVVESADSKIGFLPGQVDEKLQPYIQPLIDKLSELLPKNEINLLKKEERISAISVSFLRGLNWNAKVIIADEAQNMTFKELFTLITRTGEFSKVFILGDPDQSDINGKSGLLKMMDCFDDEESRNNGVFIFRFTDEDIVRSGLVKFIIQKTKKRF